MADYFTATLHLTKGLLDGSNSPTPIADAKVLFRASVGHVTLPSGLVADLEVKAVTDATGNISVPLLAPDAAGISPAGWTWKVAVSGNNFSTLSFSFPASGGQTIDLATVVPVPASPGAELQAWVTSVAAAESARDEAVQAAGDAATAKAAAELAATHPSDPAIAALVEDAGSQVHAALSSALVAPITDTATPDAPVGAGGIAAFYKRREGSGVYTTGDVLALGRYAFVTRSDLGTCYVQGGAPNYENVIGGNTANVNTATSNLTGAAALTGQDGNWSGILNGYDNVVNGWACTVSGFHQAVSAGANHVSIGGGSLHKVTTNTGYQTISGGTGNQADGQAAAISGGQSNTASGGWTSIQGGFSNTASANYSSAFGRNANAYLYGIRAQSSGQFAALGDAQAFDALLRRQTADATPTELFLDGSGARLVPSTGATWAITGQVVGRRTDVVGDAAAYEVKALIQKAGNGTPTVLGSVTITPIYESDATWDVAITGDSGTGSVKVTVTGATGKTIRWLASLRIVQVAS